MPHVDSVWAESVEPRPLTFGALVFLYVLVVFAVCRDGVADAHGFSKSSESFVEQGHDLQVDLTEAMADPFVSPIKMTQR